ncbi:hypothetical protein I180019D1_09070 [Alistipes sp. i18-0019-D1]
MEVAAIRYTSETTAKTAFVRNEKHPRIGFEVRFAYQNPPCLAAIGRQRQDNQFVGRQRIGPTICIGELESIAQPIGKSRLQCRRTGKIALDDFVADNTIVFKPGFEPISATFIIGPECHGAIVAELDAQFIAAFLKFRLPIKGGFYGALDLAPLNLPDSDSLSERESIGKAQTDGRPLK